MHEIEAGSECTLEWSDISDCEDHFDEQDPPTPYPPKKVAPPSQNLNTVPQKPERELHSRERYQAIH